MMSKKNKKVLMFCLCLSLLSGCVQQEIVDDINLLTAIGYDLEEDDKVIGTAVVPVYDAEGKVSNIVYEAETRASKELRSKFNAESPDPFVSGKLEVALYSKKLAEQKGIIKLIDALERDPSIGSRVFLAVAATDVSEMIEAKYGDIDTGRYLSEILEHNSDRGILAETNFHSFIYSYHAIGEDPFLPLLVLNEDKVKIDGIALFKKDKMVGKLSDEYLFTFKVLKQKFSTNDVFTVNLNDDIYASVFNIKSRRKFSFENLNEVPEVTIHFSITAIIKEYSGTNITPAVIKEIEARMEKDLKKKSEHIISKIQDLNADTLGIGREVRGRTRDKWSNKRWDELYPSIKIKVVPDVKIRETGVVE
ncbi:Ger(x)C family spore germination protein [Pseudalkalibacillus caeni]|uniref:Ger(X)C family spore germination protein n=1 Tax=Exobacillus caeni TaxID=2574798 RepID=A0A5R9F9B0_9BACL|nr:Ger(x)C family spore germination protein [Pseudalkalibacillus caeni]TLS38218.1 Ger(x)C family spore germination protein [Pseudalkalibacillus caeni]